MNEMTTETNWRPISEAPRDGTWHVRGLEVLTPDGRFLGFEAHYGRINDDGDFVAAFDAHTGWDADQYEVWFPAPAPHHPHQEPRNEQQRCGE